MVLNQKTAYITTGLKETSGIVYIAANQQTYNFLVTGSAGLTPNTIAKDNNATQQFVFETGIDNNNDPAGGQRNDKVALCVWA